MAETDNDAVNEYFLGRYLDLREDPVVQTALKLGGVIIGAGELPESTATSLADVRSQLAPVVGSSGEDHLGVGELSGLKIV